MRTTTRVAAPLALITALLALAACAGSGGEGTTSAAPAVSTTTPPPTTGSMTPTPTSPAAALADLARRGASTAFTARYALASTDPQRPDASVAIARLDTSFRVEVASGSSRMLLLTTTKGIVSCRLADTKVCWLVAGPGQLPPAPFDLGLLRLVTSDLRVLAGSSDLSVKRSGKLAAAGRLGSAQCYRVSGSGLGEGEYCLTEDGVLRKATSPSGTLTLTRLGPPPTRASFTPPVTPAPLSR